ncbi:MAG: recombination regulator RecX [Proteobacteria bacterium]|nr:recombination regulator RecX [Pseudomonadota bacterium]HQR04517.1 recombination regulator RecX [Rhodocyclaceae bacterium]
MSGLKARAVKLLARREHSRSELARKLSPHGSHEEVATVLAQMESAGLLSDERFADVYIRSHGARFGAAKLRHSLYTRGVEADLVEARLAHADLPDELTRARDLWQRKFGTPPADARSWARQARFLQSRGFAPELIRRLLKDPVEG